MDLFLNGMKTTAFPVKGEDACFCTDAFLLSDVAACFVSLCSVKRVSSRENPIILLVIKPVKCFDVIQK